MVEELVAFFQESVPELTTGAVGILGTMLILAGIDARLLATLPGCAQGLIRLREIAGRLETPAGSGTGDG